MEPKFNTSFIPKKTLKTASGGRRGKPVNVFLLISLIIFFVAVLAAVGVFLYGQYLNISIDRKEEQLARARAAFEPALIQELTRLDRKIEASKDILSDHIAPSLFFEFLEQNTLENVRFGQVVFSASTDERMSIIMNGEASGFNAVALQSDIFGRSDVVLEPVFSNLDLDAFGNVQFTVSAFVSRSALSYDRAIDIQ